MISEFTSTCIFFWRRYLFDFERLPQVCKVCDFNNVALMWLVCNSHHHAFGHLMSRFLSVLCCLRLKQGFWRRLYCVSAQFQFNVGSTLMLLCLSGNAAGGRYFFDVFIQFCSRLSSFFFFRDVSNLISHSQLQLFKKTATWKSKNCLFLDAACSELNPSLHCLAATFWGCKQ